MFSGIWIPLVTPFHHGQVDTAALRRLVRHYQGAGVSGFVALGTTGEAALLSQIERYTVLEAIADACGDRTPFLIGIGAAGFVYLLTGVAWHQAVIILGAIAALFVTLDALRFKVPALNKKVKRDFGPFMRDYELDGLSGSSWFFFSGLLSIALFPKLAAGLGIVYLAIGDPLASFVGVRWGRISCGELSGATSATGLGGGGRSRRELGGWVRFPAVRGGARLVGGCVGPWGSRLAEVDGGEPGALARGRSSWAEARRPQVDGELEAATGLGA